MAMKWTLWLVLTVLSLRGNSAERVLITRPPGTFYDTLLTIDGGGLRALLSNQILKEFETCLKEYFIDHPELLPPGSEGLTADQLEVHLADFFHVIGGVSAGSWVALYFASKGGNGASGEFLSRPDIVRKYGEHYPGSAAGLDVFFLEFGGVIYPSGIIHRVPTPRFGVTLFPFNIPGVNSPRYPVKGLERGLRMFFGETKMSELGTSCIINAYDMNTRAPVLFTFNNELATPRTAATFVRSRSAAIYGDERPMNLTDFLDELDIHWDEDFHILDVARASSALPAFHDAMRTHPIGEPSKEYTLIDGALPAPNPAFHTTNFLLRMQASRPEEGAVSDPARIAAVSVGTGYAIGSFSSSSVGGGAIGWLATGDLLQITSDGGAEAAQSIINYLVYGALRFRPLQYLRIQVVAELKDEHEHMTPEGRALNEFANPANMEMLMEIGKSTAKRHRGMIKEFVSTFIFEKHDQQSKST